MRCWVLGVIVAACEQGGYVEIHVKPPPPATPVDQVELVVGVGAETQKTLVAAGPVSLANATYWSHDPASARDVAAMSGAPVVFAYERGEFDTIAAAIAVGYRGGAPVAAATLRDLAIPDGAIHRFEAPLDPALVGGLLQWGPTATERSCVAVPPGQNKPPIAIVTDGDPDCDGFPSGDRRECTPYIHRGGRGPTLDQISCLLERDYGASGTGCVLGGPGCFDGTGPSACAESPICTPRAACEVCPSYACLTDIATANAHQVPHLDCTIRGQIDIQNQALTLCSNPVALPTVASAGPSCTSWGLRDLVQQSFAPTLTLTNFGTSTVTLTIGASGSNSCAAHITAAGNVPYATGNPRDAGALLLTTLSNGRGVALPIVFRFVSGACDSPEPCTLDPSPTSVPGIVECLSAPLPPSVDDL